MKIITDKSKDTLSSAQVESTSFTCEASPQMFQILTDKIYKDPISSLVRELISNAHDSHVQAGTLSTPIDIHVPNELEPVFSVRDYGVSMSEEDIKTVYTVFFRSSKNDNDDQVGGFGLGAKLPFAYTDQFTITTFLNGTKTVYLACKENGLPVLKKVLTTPSNEKRGVLVEVPVSNGDERYFISALKEFSHYSTFNMKYSDMNTYTPRTIVADIQKYVDMFDCNTKVYEAPDCQEIIIRLGGVSYEITVSENLVDSWGLRRNIERHIERRHTKVCWDLCNVRRGYALVLDYPVGSLQPTASRESLQLTEKNKREIVYRIEALRIRLNKYINEQGKAISTQDEEYHNRRHLNSLKSWIGFQRTFVKMDRVLSLKSLYKEYFFYNNKKSYKFGESVSFDTESFINDDVRNCRVLYYKNERIRQSKVANVGFQSEYQVYLTKLPISHIAESNLSQELQDTNRTFCVIQLKQRVDINDFLAELKDRLGEESDYFSFSELPDDFVTFREKKVKNTSTQRKISKNEKLERYKTQYGNCIEKWGKILFVDTSGDSYLSSALECLGEEFLEVTYKRDLEFVEKHPEVFERVTINHPVLTSHKKEIVNSYVVNFLFSSNCSARIFVRKYGDKLSNKRLVELFKFYENGNSRRINKLSACHPRMFPACKCEYDYSKSRGCFKFLTAEEMLLYLLEDTYSYYSYDFKNKCRGRKEIVLHTDLLA